MEQAMRRKIGSNFDSVRKAFLYMDGDHDGYITAEDFLRIFKNDIKIDVEDLAKLLVERDHNKIGRLNYEAFSSWVGTCIH